jgi:hypothetical protein
MFGSFHSSLLLDCVRSRLATRTRRYRDSGAGRRPATLEVRAATQSGAAIATVAIRGAVGPADVEGLGVRLLEGDVAAAARSVAAIEAFPAR